MRFPHSSQAFPLLAGLCLRAPRLDGTRRVYIDTIFLGLPRGFLRLVQHSLVIFRGTTSLYLSPFIPLQSFAYQVARYNICQLRTLAS